MSWKLAFQAVRPFAFPTTIVPITIGAFYYWELGIPHISWPLYLLTLLCGVAIHGGTNLNNDYWDYINGVDRVYSFGSSKLLPMKVLHPKQVKRLASVFFFVSFLLSLTLGVFTDLRVTAIAIIGILVGYYYTAPPLHFKYRGFGPVLVFVMMGPLMVSVGGLVQSGQWDMELFLISAPIGFLVSLILQSNDIRDISWDNFGGITTMAIYLGENIAVAVFFLLGLLAFISISLLNWLGILSGISIVTWLFIPWFLTLNAKINKGTAAQLLNIDIQMTKLYSGVGIILLLSVIL